MTDILHPLPSGIIEHPEESPAAASDVIPATEFVPSESDFEAARRLIRGMGSRRGPEPESETEPEETTEENRLAEEQAEARRKEKVAEVLARARLRRVKEELAQKDLETAKAIAAKKTAASFAKGEPTSGESVDIDALGKASLDVERERARRGIRSFRRKPELPLPRILPQKSGHVPSSYEVVVRHGRHGRHRRPGIVGKTMDRVFGSGAHASKKTTLPEVTIVERPMTVQGRVGLEAYRALNPSFSLEQAVELINDGQGGDLYDLAGRFYPGVEVDHLSRTQQRNLNQYLPALEAIEYMEQEAQAGNPHVYRRDLVRFRLFGIDPSAPRYRETPEQKEIIDAAWHRINRPWDYRDSKTPKSVHLAMKAEPQSAPKPDHPGWIKTRWNYARQVEGKGRVQAALGVAATAVSKIFAPPESIPRRPATATDVRRDAQARAPRMVGY